MSEIYLASSALIHEGFDGFATIREARKHLFDGVQLYLDPSYRDVNYRDGVVKSLSRGDLGVVLHMPNIPTPLDISAIRDLQARLGRSRTLIHYEPLTKPFVSDLHLGWENSRNGTIKRKHQDVHLRELRNAVRRDNTFIVFDMGRMAYTDELTDEDRTIGFIREQMNRLIHRRDIIHTADKDNWEVEFRNGMCALGNGVMKHFLSDLQHYHGIIVFEYEDLNMAIESRRILLRGY